MCTKEKAVSVRVYRFQRNNASDILPGGQSVSTAAAIALTAAINGQQAIFYEEFTELNNPQPIMAVVFAGRLCMQHFDSLIEATLALGGISAGEVRHLEPYASFRVGELRKADSANNAPANLDTHASKYLSSLH